MFSVTLPNSSTQLLNSGHHLDKKEDLSIDKITNIGKINLPNSIENFGVSKDIKTWDILPQSLNEVEIDYIDNFITYFLHPYITGQINSKNESKERKPMIDLLMENFHPSKKQEVQNKALEFYFEKAALGMYVNLQLNSKKRDIVPNEKEMMGEEIEVLTKNAEEDDGDLAKLESWKGFDQNLVKALEVALPKDFPEIKMTHEEIREKAVNALDLVNKKRAQAKKEALNYKRPPRGPDLRKEKLKKLISHHEIFLIDCLPITESKPTTIKELPQSIGFCNIL